MLNMKRKSGPSSIVLALLLTACAGSPTTESTGEYLDNAAITAKIKAAFIKDKQVKASNIKVETFRGTVQLSGYADSRSQIERATQIAGAVPGVKSVRNEIDLNSSSVSAGQ